VGSSRSHMGGPGKRTRPPRLRCRRRGRGPGAMNRGRHGQLGAQSELQREQFFACELLTPVRRQLGRRESVSELPRTKSVRRDPQQTRSVARRHSAPLKPIGTQVPRREPESDRGGGHGEFVVSEAGTGSGTSDSHTGSYSYRRRRHRQPSRREVCDRCRRTRAAGHDRAPAAIVARCERPAVCGRNWARVAS
jgi:hypothetical protein